MAVSLDSTALAGLSQHGGKLTTGGLVEGHVRYQAIAKKCRNAIFGAVHKLIRDQELPRPQILLQRAHRAGGNNPLHAQQLRGADIRSKIDFARKDALPYSVTR